MRVNAITMRDHFGGGVSLVGGVWVLCKRAPATLYPHHSVGGLVARRHGVDVLGPILQD